MTPEFLILIALWCQGIPLAEEPSAKQCRAKLYQCVLRALHPTECFAPPTKPKEEKEG